MEEEKIISRIKYKVEEELPSMVELFSVESYTGKEYLMLGFIEDIISKIEGLTYQKDVHGNILITKGNIATEEYYPCIIAHTDTVHPFVEGYQVKVREESNFTKLWAVCSKADIIKGSNLTGIGGDDKCGIWLALKLLEELPILKVVFTVEEECGAIGASKLDYNFFNDVGYLIEGDRKGNSDIITNIWDDICSQEFLDAIKEVKDLYNYKETYGMLTDIAAIKENSVDICAINVSVGYYKPHEKEEYIIAEDLLNATSFIKDCISTLGYNKYEHISENIIRQSKFEDYYNQDSLYRDVWEDWDYPYNKICSCTSKITDLSCDTHNRILNRFSGKICSCGEELEEREYSYNCPFCTKIYM